MSDAERGLLFGIAESLYSLLRSNEEQRLAHAWEHETTPSDRLARQIANLRAEGARNGHPVRLSNSSTQTA